MAEKLGVYIHIPFCRSKCDYCDFYSLAGREDRMDDYQKALLAHMKETAPLARGFQVDTVYFGGGTPSYYGEKRLRALLKAVAKWFDLAKDAEVTVECNPDSVDRKMLLALRRAGATFLDEAGGETARRTPITKADLVALGLSGGPGAAERRRALLKALDLPERLSPNAMLEALNALFTPEELAEAASEKIFRENEKKT